MYLDHRDLPLLKVVKRSLNVWYGNQKEFSPRRNKHMRSKLVLKHGSFSYGIQNRGLQNLVHSNCVDTIL